MTMKSIKFLIFAVTIMLVGILGINFAEGAKNQLPTLIPTEFSATAVSPTQISLSWLAPSQNYGKIIVGYKIEQNLGNGIYDVVVDNTGSTITTYSMTGLKTGTAYTYRVSAVYSDDTSTDPSDPATATPLLTSVPPPPTSSPPLSSPIANEKFDFVPADGTTLIGVVISHNDYLGLQYKKDPRSIIIDAAPTTESINNSLDRLISYQVNHMSDDSVPAPLIAKAISPTKISLSWLPPIVSYDQTLLGYKIELKNAPGDYQVIDDNTGNDTTKYTVTGLSPGTTYTYRVFAVYTGTHSNPSNEASAVTLVQTQVPVGNPNQTSPNTSENTSPTTQVNNVQFDLTAPDESTLPGIIIPQNDYQQFVVIKDPRTILSNVTPTTNTINNNLAGILRYQNIHVVQSSVNPPIISSNSTPAPNTVTPENPASPNLNVLYGVITSVIASSVVGIITWLVKTKLARKIAKSYNFTIEKLSPLDTLQIRIRNSGETIEDCIIMCEKHICIWTDTQIDKPRHVYEGSISIVNIPDEYEDKNPLIIVKSGKKILRKINLDDMAHA
jgi:titin